MAFVSSFKASFRGNGALVPRARRRRAGAGVEAGESIDEREQGERKGRAEDEGVGEARP